MALAVELAVDGVGGHSAVLPGTRAQSTCLRRPPPRPVLSASASTLLAASVVERPAEQVLPVVDDALDLRRATSAGGFTTTVQPVVVDGLPPDALAVRGADPAEDGSGVRHVVAAAGTGAATVMVLVVTPLGDVDEALVADAVTTAHARLPTSWPLARPDLTST